MNAQECQGLDGSRVRDDSIFHPPGEVGLPARVRQGSAETTHPTISWPHNLEDDTPEDALEPDNGVGRWVRHLGRQHLVTIVGDARSVLVGLAEDQRGGDTHNRLFIRRDRDGIDCQRGCSKHHIASISGNGEYGFAMG